MTEGSGREGQAVEPHDDAARELVLVVKADDGTERTYPLGDRTMVIGRATASDVVLPDADKGASRRHAELRYDAGRYVIVDLESQNGTWVNGEKLNRSAVVAGTEIVIGTYRLRVEYGTRSVADMPLSKPAPPRAAAAGVPARSGPSWTTVGTALAVAVAAVAFAAWRTYVASHPAAPPAATPVAVPAPVSVAPPSPAEAPADAPPVAAPDAAPTGSGAGSTSDPAPVPAAPKKSTALATPSPNRAAALTAFQAGVRLDAAGDWVGALKKFDEARELDPTVPDLDRAAKQATDKVRQAGYDALQRAVDDERKGNVTEAIKEYDRAIQWLPQGDRRREMATTRLAQLKEGVK
jgi:predicted component of type VI protein secretion system